MACQRHRTEQPWVYHRHVHTLRLDLRYRFGERPGFEREDHERVDLVCRDQILQLVGLLARVGRGFDRDLQVLMLPLQLFLSHVRPPNDAGREAVRRRAVEDALSLLEQALV